MLPATSPVSDISWALHAGFISVLHVHRLSKRGLSYDIDTTRSKISLEKPFLLNRESNIENRCNYLSETVRGRNLLLRFLFYITSLRLVVDLCQSMFPQEGVDLVSIPQVMVNLALCGLAHGCEFD